MTMYIDEIFLKRNHVESCEKLSQNFSASKMRLETVIFVGEVEIAVTQSFASNLCLTRKFQERIQCRIYF